MIEWFTVNWQWYGIAFAAIVIEVAYALWLMSLPSPERRAAGYSLLMESIESLGYGVLLLGAIASLESAVLAGVRIVPPALARAYWQDSLDKLINYLYHIADVQKWLTLTVIFAPFTTTLQSSAFLLTNMAHYLILVSSAMLFITDFVTHYGSAAISIGIGLTSTRRFRTLGSYMIFSVLAMTVASGFLAPIVRDTIYQLEFVKFQVIVEFLRKFLGTFDITKITVSIVTGGAAVTEALMIIFGTLPQWYINDGKLLAELAVKVTIALSLITAAAAAASRAAGGFVDTILSRVRGL
jgi:hypothetical protein